MATGRRTIGTRHDPTVDPRDLARIGNLVPLDVRYGEPLLRLVEEARPAWIFHLAAQSLPAVSWARPQETLETNVMGTVNLFEAVKRIRRADPAWAPRIVVACSSAEYGAGLPANLPVTEEAPLLPLHPYGVSKVAQDLLARQYFVNDAIAAVRARIFNTTGPRKRGDVVSDFAARVAHLRRTGCRRLAVGNLEARRAILDVADTVAALVRLAEAGRAGEVYNVSGGTAHRIGDLVPLFAEAAGIAIEAEVDPALLRPSDEPAIVGSTARLRQDTGWAPRVPLRDTVAAVLAYEMERDVS